MKTPPPSTPGSQSDQNDRASVERAFVDLASRTDLPERVHGALRGILDICTKHVSAWLDIVLDDLERELFVLAERSPNNEVQQTYFDSSRDLKLRRADLVQRFLAAIEDCIVRFDEREMDTASEQGRSANTRAGLSIMTSSELDEMLALQEMTSKSVAREIDELLALGQRFGVLAGRPEVDFESLPVGPAMLARALRHATKCLDIPVEHRVLLYRTFDRKAMSEAGNFYGSLNVYFRDQRILENLRVMTAEEKFAAARRATDNAETDAPAKADEGSVQSSDAPPAEGPGPADPQSKEALLDALSAIDATEAVTRRSWGLGGWSLPTHAPNIGADARSPEPFSAIREFLQRRRHSGSRNSATHGDGRAATADDLQNVLRTMHAARSVQNPAGILRRAIDIKRELLAQLHRSTPEAEPARLTDEDSDTIDLMSMLFDAISANPRSGHRTKALLAKLQMPLLRVPLRDKTFFSSREHPGRQLLDAIAEIGMDWLDDPSGESDRILTDKIDRLTDRVAQEFDGDFGLIEEVLLELAVHLRTLVRKAEASERRHVTTAKGREKLLAARTLAADEIARCLSRGNPSLAIRTLLEQSWADVLALTVLRNGADSAAYKDVVAVADRLACIVPQDVTAPDPTLRAELERGLQQVGFHQNEIDEVVAHVFAVLETTHADSSHADITELLKGRARFGDAGIGEQRVDPATVSIHRDARDDGPSTPTTRSGGKAEVRQYWVSDAAAQNAELESGEPRSADNSNHDPQEIPVAQIGSPLDARIEPAVQGTLPLGNPEVPVAAATRANILSPEERNTLALLRTIPFGTWFEFTMERGKRVRRRLSWYSPMTGRCLFVNQRGMQVDECTMEQLASDLVCKRAVAVKNESESIVDRAYRAIVDSLKSITGFGSETESVPV